LKLSKAFFLRLFWFVLGGVLSIAVNAGLFRLFHSYFGWNRYVAYGLSLAIINVLLFLWNYVVGFKSDRHWTDSAWRQGVCLAVANGLNYLLVMGLLSLFPGWPSSLLTTVQSVVALFKSDFDAARILRWPELIIAAVQVFIAFFKFGLYHYWVYPQQDAPAAWKEIPAEKSA